MDKTNILSDEACIARVTGGDTEAFGLLVARYNDKLIRMLMLMVGDRCNAEDLAQEVMIKAFTGLDSFHGHCSFSTWLYRIAYNKAVSDMRKKRNRYTEVPLNDSILQVEDDDDETETVTESPETLRWALAQLDPKDQTLLSLYYGEGKSVSELSLIAGQSPSNIKIRLFRLRNKLKKIMSAYEER
ncbi:RNA polymerase sigma factor [Porphyromonas sp.]|uniref:RNA polymerase sigma factor n=1 Tax=Porphyromonas sp. TaxID=1924944 RepID=UPI0026DAE9F1|nr:sigma-70 family RNA polymerase sigma factor [Porphyromonas sp.]MDO4770576.1 sigma-70 family RNA polymerase sigma factor [Porphyromonas sp.]